MAERNDLLIAKLLGAPIDPNLNVPVAIAEIAEVEKAQPGELVRIFNSSDEDSNVDDNF